MGTTGEAGFISYDKRGNRTYAYRRVNGRDPETNKVRCVKKEYLGIYDPQTDTILRLNYAAEKVKNVYNYGAHFVLEHILTKLGLLDILGQIYSADDVVRYKELVFYKCITSEPLHLFPYWKEESFLKESIRFFTPSDISRFLSRIGKSTGQREELFLSWAKRQQADNGVFFDLTSISSHCTEIEFAERGYNKDRDLLEQVNLGMIYSHTSGRPIAYRTYPGSIRYVSTIKNMAPQQNLWVKITASSSLDKGP
jgi:hypothetical protein